MLSNRASLLIFLILTSVAATGCGKSSGVRDTGSFEPYVARFEGEAQGRGVGLTVDNLVVRFGQTNPGERGFCEFGQDDVPTIVINDQAWDSSTEAEREELLFHELGHCVLGRQHDSELAANGLPKSMMYPVKLSEAVYSPTRAQYLNELFSK